MEEKEEEEMERREKQMNRFQCDLWCVMGEKIYETTLW